MPGVKEVRQRVLWRALGSPLVLGPFVAGATAGTGVWALGGPVGIGVFAVLAGFLSSAGLYCTRLVFRGDRLMHEVMTESLREQEVQRQKALDALDQALCTADDDPRPETALRDLRALVKAFQEAEEATLASGQLPLAVDLVFGVRELFDQCVHSLRQTAQLWNTAQRLTIPASRQPLLTQRENLINDVQACVKQLSETLAGLQALGTRDGSSVELSRLRSELDRSLALARTVEERVNTMLEDPSLPTAAPSEKKVPRPAVSE